MKHFVVAFLLVASSFSYANFAWPLPQQLKVSLLDVGQGESIFIQTPHGRTILVDGGPGNKILEQLSEQGNYFLQKIDLLVLTHPDLDHLEGFLNLLERYRVGALLFNGRLEGSFAYQEFLQKIANLNIPAVKARSDQDWQLDEGIFLDVITPGMSKELMATTNNSALLLKLVYGKTSLLLMSDSEKEEELALLRSDTDIRSQILKVGHHGSITSSTDALLRAVQTKEAIISSGKNNRYDHPHLATILALDESGIAWSDTQDAGTITVKSDGKTWH